MMEMTSNCDMDCETKLEEFEGENEGEIYGSSWKCNNPAEIESEDENEAEMYDLNGEHDSSPEIEYTDRQMELDAFFGRMPEVKGDNQETTWDAWFASVIKSWDTESDLVTQEKAFKQILGQKRKGGPESEIEEVGDKGVQLLRYLEKIKDIHCGKSVNGKCKNLPSLPDARTVAMLSRRAMSAIPWAILQKKLRKEKYQMFRDRVFEHIAIFALGVFDGDDFARLVEVVLLQAQFESFYNELCKKLHNSSSENASDHAIASAKSILRGDRGQDYHLLREHDISDMLWHYRLFSDDFEAQAEVYQNFVYQFAAPEQSDVEMVEQIIERCPKLKDKYRMQILLEMSVGMCYNACDKLFLEAWTNIRITDLREEFSDLSELGEFVTFFNICMDELFIIKRIMMRRNLAKLSFPMLPFVYGPCTKDFFRAIWLADVERRIENYKFIRLRHILSALAHTNLGLWVNVIIDYQGVSKMENLNFPIYDIYKASKNAAVHFGDSEVGLEHLFLAILFEILEDNALKQNPAQGTHLAIGEISVDAELLNCLRDAKHSPLSSSYVERSVWSFLHDADRDGQRHWKCSDISMLEQLSKVSGLCSDLR